MAKRTDKKTFLSECKAKILEHAGPFCEFTEEAAAQLDQYLAEDLIEVEEGGKQRTRHSWSESPIFKDAFFRRLAFVGKRAADAGERRMEMALAAGDPTPDIGALHLDDLEEAQETVGGFSATSRCSP